MVGPIDRGTGAPAKAVVGEAGVGRSAQAAQLVAGIPGIGRGTVAGQVAVGVIGQRGAVPTDPWFDPIRAFLIAIDTRIGT